MQLTEFNEIVTSNGKSTDDVVHREVLKLSNLDVGLVSDLSAMFGMWKEADHCDKDIS